MNPANSGPPPARPADFALPPGASRPPSGISRTAGIPLAAGIPYLSAHWTAPALADLVAVLARADLRGIPDEALLDAWSATVEAFLDPASPERRELGAGLAASWGLSPSGLAAALAAVLGGVRRPAAAAMLQRAAALHNDAIGAAVARPAGVPPVLVVLAANLPALAVQPLLPCLALRLPVLLKSPSAEPLFAPALIAALTRREPRLGAGLAAVTWPGGDAVLEAPVLAAVDTVLAYGSAAAISDLDRRAPGKVVAYGPKTSIAVLDLATADEPDDLSVRRMAAALGRDLAPRIAANTADAPDLSGLAAGASRLVAGLARDIARFDQRGCLSVAAVYVRGDLAAAVRLAARLEAALGALATLWPPGPAAPAALAQVQHARLETELRGLPRARLPVTAGTVLVEPEPAFRPSPGLRTVRVQPLPDLDRLPEILAPWRDRLQGAALAGAAAWRLAPRLADLGVSRFAAPGDLQSPDAAWHNGGIDPLKILAASAGRNPRPPRPALP